MSDRYTLGLRRTAQVIRAEKTIEAAAYKALRALGETAKHQLAHSGMNPDVLDARHPAWQRQVDEHLIPAIAAVFRTAYDQGTITAAAQAAEGPIRSASDLAADRYLSAATRNRLVGVSDTVYGQIVAAISEGRATGGGESIPQLSARVDALLDDTQRWRNRATVIARTEAIGAHNAGYHAAAAENAAVMGYGEGQVVKEWLATHDARTRPSHQDASGQKVTGMHTPFSVSGSPMQYPGDPAGPAAEVIQCRCTTLYHYPGDPGYPDEAPAVVTDPAPEAQFVDRIHADLAAGNVTPEQLRAAVADRSRLSQVNVEAAIARREAEVAAQAVAEAETAVVNTETAAAREGVAARVQTPQEVIDALTPGRGGWTTTTRAKTVEALKSTPEGRDLLRTIDSFQSGSSSAIPRLRTDVEKFLAGASDLPQGRQDAIENLLSAIGNSPAPDGKSLWRGMSLPGDIDSVLARYASGSDLDLSISSFSSDKGIAQSFMDGGAGQRVRGKVQTKVLVEWVGDGKRALPIQNLGKSRVFANEKEWVGAGRYKIGGARKVKRNGVETVLVQIRQVGAW